MLSSLHGINVLPLNLFYLIIFIREAQHIKSTFKNNSMVNLRAQKLMQCILPSLLTTFLMG